MNHRADPWPFGVPLNRRCADPERLPVPGRPNWWTIKGKAEPVYVEPPPRKAPAIIAAAHLPDFSLAPVP